MTVKDDWRYTTIIEQSGQVIYDAAEGCPATWFGAIETITGYPAKKVAKWSREQWNAQIHPDDRSAVVLAVEQARKKLELFRLEYRFQLSDGRHIWLEENGRFVIESSGRRLIGIIKDINRRKMYETELIRYQNRLETMVTERTREMMAANENLSKQVEERRRAEAALKISERRYQRVFENTGTATVLIEPDLTISMANAKAETLAGMPRSEFVGKLKATAFVTPSQRDRLLLYHQLMMGGQSKTPDRMEFKILNHKGRIRQVLANTQFIPDTGQVVISMLDVTRTNRIQKERRRLAAVIEQSAEAVVITDNHGRIEYVNKMFENLSGYSRKELVGQSADGPVFAELDRRIIAQMTFMVSPEDTWSGRVKNRRRDGRFYIADTRIFPLCDPKGRPTNLVCIKIDVTTEVQLETQLQHAQKMEAIGTLAGGIAHDFNNILGGILGFTELSLRQAAESDERLQRNLQRIMEGCQRAKELIHHILTFSRKRDDQLQPLELQLVLKEALKLLRATIPTTIEFRQRIVKEPCIVHSSPTRIHQIVMNLCTNAAQAMESTGGLLEINLEKIELNAKELHGEAIQPGPFVRLTVSDSGKGIDSSTLPRIFDPYFTTKASTGGTGLGLAIVHGIVKNMGGSIHVTSEPGLGSTFEIYLPRMDDTVVPTEKDTLASPAGGKERILVVDDEIVILEILREMLEGLGYRVETAESGEAVLHRLRRHPDSFDLVITDWVMPKMNGRQLAEQIVILNPNLPIILATGTDVADQYGPEALNLFRATLLKPVKYNDLALAVRQALDQRDSRDQGRE